MSTLRSRRTSRLPLVWLLLLVGSAFGCAAGTDGSETPDGAVLAGSLGSPCDVGERCDADLVCDANFVCVTQDPCAGITCTGHGSCGLVDGSARCLCDTDYHAQGLECVADSEPCAEIDCSGNGTCAVESDTALCVCDSGFHAQGLTCVADADPCNGVDCSGHGTCELASGADDVDFYTECEDTYLAGETNHASDTEQLELYTWPANTAANTILIRCDLSGIPAGAAVSAASLDLYMHGLDGAGGDESYAVGLHGIIDVLPIVSAATWSTYDGSQAWSTPGGLNDIGPVVSTTTVDKMVGFKTWDMTSLVQTWITGPSDNRGLLLVPPAVATTDSNRLFRPGDYSVAAERPKLRISYDVAQSTEPVCTCDAGYVAEGQSCVAESVPAALKLQWEGPTSNTDGSCATDLAGYKLYRGQASGSYGYLEPLPLAGLDCVDSTESTSCGLAPTCSRTIADLAPGTWYFTVTAYNAAGVESAQATELEVVAP